MESLYGMKVICNPGMNPDTIALVDMSRIDFDVDRFLQSHNHAMPSSIQITLPTRMDPKTIHVEARRPNETD
jgi:hypothetical protein